MVPISQSLQPPYGMRGWVITLLDVLYVTNIPGVLNSGWKERRLHPAPSWNLRKSNTTPLTGRAVLSLQLGTLKFANFCQLLSFLSPLQLRDGKRNRFFCLEFHSRSESKAAGDAGLGVREPRLALPPEISPCSLERVMERAESAGSGTAGRCLC